MGRRKAAPLLTALCVINMDNLLSGFFGAMLGVFGSLFIYWHSQKSKYKLEVLGRIELMIYTVRYEHKAYENTFKLFKEHILPLQLSVQALMAFSFNKACVDKIWHDFKGMKYAHKKQGAEYMSLPDNADEALKRLNDFRNAIQNT